MEAPEPGSSPPPPAADPTRAMRRYADALLVLAAVRCALVAIEMREDLIPVIRGLWDPRWRSYSLGPAVEPIDLVRVGWTLGLAVLIRVTRWPALAKGAALTMGVLVLHRLIGAALGAAVATATIGPIARRVAVGFEIGSEPTIAAMTVARRLLAFGIDLGFTLVALRLWRRARRAAAPPRGSGRAIAVRLTMLGVLVFASILLGSRAWDAYVDVLNLSPRIRQMILRTSPNAQFPPARNFRGRRPPGERSAILEKLFEGIDLEGRRRHAEAHTAGAEAVRLLALEAERPGGRRLGAPPGTVAGAANNLAWSFATGPEPRREPGIAVSLSRASLDLVDDGMTWNTLGVAELRAGNEAEARKAFARSMSLRDGGDSFDWFFLAILRQREGDAAGARAEYDRAVRWYGENRPEDPELRRFQLEAAEALGLPAPVPPKAGPAAPKRRLGAARPVPSVVD